MSYEPVSAGFGDNGFRQVPSILDLRQVGLDFVWTRQRGLGSGEVCSCGHPAKLHTDWRCWPNAPRTSPCDCRVLRPILTTDRLDSFRYSSRGHGRDHALMRGLADLESREGGGWMWRWIGDDALKCEGCGNAGEPGRVLPYGIKGQDFSTDGWVHRALVTVVLCTECASLRRWPVREPGSVKSLLGLWGEIGARG